MDQKTGQVSRRKCALKVSGIWTGHKKLESGQDWGQKWETERLCLGTPERDSTLMERALMRRPGEPGSSSTPDGSVEGLRVRNIWSPAIF